MSNPPSPPSTLSYAGPAGEAGALTLDNTKRAKWAVVLLGIMLIFSLLNVPFQIYGWYSTDVTAMATSPGFTPPPPAVPTTGPAATPANPFGNVSTSQIVFGAIQGAFGCMSLLVMIGAIIAYAMWQYRASQNANTAVTPTRHSPGMGVGWWFIPIANLAMAGLVLRDLWRASHARQDEGQGGFNPATPAWLCWVGIWVLAFGGGALSFYSVFTQRQGFLIWRTWSAWRMRR